MLLRRPLPRRLPVLRRRRLLLLLLRLGRLTPLAPPRSLLMAPKRLPAFLASTLPSSPASGPSLSVSGRSRSFSVTNLICLRSAPAVHQSRGVIGN